MILPAFESSAEDSDIEDRGNLYASDNDDENDLSTEPEFDQANSESSDEISLPVVPFRRPAVWSGSPDYLEPLRKIPPIASILFTQLGNPAPIKSAVDSNSAFNDIAPIDRLAFRGEKNRLDTIDPLFNSFNKHLGNSEVPQLDFPSKKSSFSSIRVSPFAANNLSEDSVPRNLPVRPPTTSSDELDDLADSQPKAEKKVGESGTNTNVSFIERLRKVFPFPEQAGLIEKLLYCGISEEEMQSMKPGELENVLVELELFTKYTARIVAKKIENSF